MKVGFWKYEGAGNDFILIDARMGGESAEAARHPGVELSAETIRALCDRHRGVGADGLMLLRDADGYDFRMEYHNSDGGEADMCGNGGRCISLFAHKLGIGVERLSFVGRDGVHHARITEDNGDWAMVELGMKDVEGYEYGDRSFLLDTGVPHYVRLVDDLAAVDVEREGRRLRNDERFAKTGGANIDFVKLEGEGRLSLRTYERGVEGETLACGTGAVAAAIAAHIFAQDTVTRFSVGVVGGALEVSFTKGDEERFTGIKLTGPARCVFRGVIDTAGLGSIPGL